MCVGGLPTKLMSHRLVSASFAFFLGACKRVRCQFIPPFAAAPNSAAAQRYQFPCPIPSLLLLLATPGGRGYWERIMPSRKRRRDATSAAEPLHSLQSKISNDPSTWASKPSPPNEDNTTTTQADDESIEEGEVALADDSDGVVSVGRKQKRPRLMQASGQSNADRRKLRRKQRELKGELIGLSDDVAEDEFHDYRERNNDLWGKVRYTREAGLDGDNVQIIAEKSAMKAEKLVTVSILGLLFLSDVSNFCAEGGTLIMNFLVTIPNIDSTLRCRPPRSMHCQKRYCACRFLLQIQLAWSWLSGRSLLQCPAPSRVIPPWSS